MSCACSVSRSLEGTRKESRQIWVSLAYHICCSTAKGNSTDPSRFMFDKIMPLKEAVEGYELFNDMKVQKVIFKP